MLMLHDFRVRQRDFLLEISRAMTAQLDIGEVLRLVLNASVAMMGGEVGLIALRNVDNDYRVRATLGIDNKYLDNINRQLQDLVADATSGLDNDQVSARMRRMATSLDPRLQQSVALPLVMAGEPLGLLIIFRAYRGNPSPDDLQVLQSFADQAAIAVHNAQLYAGIDQERRRLRAILQHSADGVMILDPHLNILSFNRALERMTGWTAEEAIGLSLRDVIRWDSVEIGDIEAAIVNGWPAMMGSEEDEEVDNTYYVEGDLLRKDSAKLSIGITYAPLVARNGHLANLIANVRDITNFRKAQEMQNMFVSTVSHELRTPITLIKGYAGTLNRDDVTWDPAVLRDSLTVIEEESDRLNALVDNLITASKIQARRELEVNPTKTRLDEVALRAVERFSKQAARHTLVADFPAGYPLAYIDEVRMRQVIDNLISNAVKYSPDGGEVRVAGSFTDEEIIVSVSDQGVGMTEQEQENLFQRFYRVDNVLSRKTEGTGLGLYLSRAIVEAHGGTIGVSSFPNRGSTFSIILPRDHNPTSHIN
jgi:PAS domain S-box-containing protein